MDNDRAPREREPLEREADDRRGADLERLALGRLDRLDRDDREAVGRDREGDDRFAAGAGALRVDREADRLDPRFRGGPAYVSMAATTANSAAKAKGR